MNTNFFLNALHVFSSYVRDVDDFASVDRFGGIWRRPVALLLSRVNLVCDLLSLNDLAVLTLTQLFIHVNQEPVDLAYVGLFIL